MPQTRFLIVRLSSIGDIVHALPAVAALGRAHPQAEIDWAIESRFAMLIKGNPFVHRTIEFGPAKDISALRSFAAKLREMPYDAAVDFQGLLKSAIVAKLSRSRERIGFGGRWVREKPAAALYTRRILPEGRRHVIEINLALVEALRTQPGRWEFPLPDSEEAGVQRRLAELGIADYVIINPGGGWKAKRWSAENYAALICALEREIDYDLLLTGSPGEEPLIREILAKANCPRARYFGSTLLEFIALARRARLLIGGDTGPLHIAAAAGTPLVAIFNASDPLNTPERNGPFCAADIVLIGRCETNGNYRTSGPGFLEGVSVGAVRDAALRRLAGLNG